MGRALAGQVDSNLSREAALVFGGAYSTRHPAHSAVKYASDWPKVASDGFLFTRLGVIGPPMAPTVNIDRVETHCGCIK
jgi:hypothetical protein